MQFNKPTSTEKAKFKNFVGSLVVIVPHQVTKSRFTKTTKDGSTYYPDQTIASVIPVEDIAFRNSDGENVSHDAGTAYRTYIGVKAQKQLGGLGEPVLARVVKGKAQGSFAPATILQDPTEEEVALAGKVLADFDLDALNASYQPINTASDPDPEGLPPAQAAVNARPWE